MKKKVVNVVTGETKKVSLTVKEIGELESLREENEQEAKKREWVSTMAELSKFMPRYLEELKDNNPDLVLSDFQQEKYNAKKALRAKQPKEVK